MLSNNNDDSVLYAGFFVRLSAYIIDSIIVGMVLLIIKIPKLVMWIMNPDTFLCRPIVFKFSIMDIVIYLLTLMYFVLMTYNSGATIGKKLLKIKVCKQNGENLSFVDVLYRESIGKYLSALIIFIGYIMIAVDTKKRALHDMLCDTVVVYNFDKPNSIQNSSQEYTEVQPIMESTQSNMIITDNNQIEINSDDINNNGIETDKGNINDNYIEFNKDSNDDNQMN